MTLKEALKIAQEKADVARCNPIEMQHATNGSDSATIECNTGATNAPEAPKYKGLKCIVTRNNLATSTPKPVQQMGQSGGQFVASESRSVALVWDAWIDGRRLTVIDPDHYSPEQMREALSKKFGACPVGVIRQQGARSE